MMVEKTCEGAGESERVREGVYRKCLLTLTCSISSLSLSHSHSRSILSSLFSPVMALSATLSTPSLPLSMRERKRKRERERGREREKRGRERGERQKERECMTERRERDEFR